MIVPMVLIVCSVIIHYTGINTAQEVLDRLCNPAAEVSSHYTIDEDGTYNYVDPAKRAWHTGIV